ncbi:hypothetical protein L208DRAFT_1378362 [Tricholoma matsutake]|nr:hypothetical protein L208DRAFT_1378362 [Tricholoma matsutake 945]
MAEASWDAQTYNTILEIGPGVLPWADITPKVCGGWWMMVMVTSGSVVRNAVNWDLFTGLISKYVAQHTFGGQETMAHDIQPFVNGLVERVAVHGINGDPWETVSETLVAFPTSITTNTVIAICKTTSGFTASQIGIHRAEQPLGYAFTKCGTANCPSKGHPGHMIGELKDDAVRIQCKTSINWPIQILES